MTLYGTAGYINVVAIPQPVKDDSRHAIDWTIDIDEGKTYNFGRLILDGPEPRAGAGYALLDSWNTLDGKQYTRSPCSNGWWRIGPLGRMGRVCRTQLLLC